MSPQAPCPWTRLRNNEKAPAMPGLFYVRMVGPFHRTTLPRCRRGPVREPVAAGSGHHWAARLPIGNDALPSGLIAAGHPSQPRRVRSPPGARGSADPICGWRPTNVPWYQGHKPTHPAHGCHSRRANSSARSTVMRTFQLEVIAGPCPGCGHYSQASDVEWLLLGSVAASILHAGGRMGRPAFWGCRPRRPWCLRQETGLTN